MATRAWDLRRQRSIHNRWRLPPPICFAPLLLFALACGRSPVHGNGQPQIDARFDTSVARDASSDKGPPGSDALGDAVKPGTDGPPPPPDVRVDVPPDMRADLQPDIRPSVDVPSCPVDCTKLPHLRPGIMVPCIGGQCSLPFNACMDGFGHCSFDPNSGCETDLTTSSSCGACAVTCSGRNPVCKRINNTFFTCGAACVPPTSDSCGFACLDLQSDQFNCGSCGNVCYSPNANTACQSGKCIVLGCSDPAFADCTSDPGCETQLGSNDNCGKCGDKACALANTMFTCNDGVGCAAAVCAPGFANCSTTNPDCETTFAAPGTATCLPHYLGTEPIATQNLDRALTAMAPDGSFFIAGTFTGSVDFDPSLGRDIRSSPNGTDGYITKFSATGTYAWTATLVGRGDLQISGIALTAAGGVVVSGSYTDTVDLDPGAAVDIHFTASASNSEPFVLKLTAAGALVWGRTFAATTSDGSGSGDGITVDATDAVYVFGSFSGSVDFDPTTGTDVRTANQTTPYLVKLTTTGGYGWTQLLTNGDCTASLFGITTASDGNIWVTGAADGGPGCRLAPLPDGNQQTDALIAKFGPAGDTRGTWVLGNGGFTVGEAMAPGRDGSVYIAGAASGSLDFDPGAGVVRRWTGGGGGFVLKLDATGAFRWVNVTDQVQITALAGTPDGGVIASSDQSTMFVTRLTADGASIWTLPSTGNNGTVRSVAASVAGFVIAGTNSGSGDFDPGPDLDLIYGDVEFVSHFTF